MQEITLGEMFEQLRLKRHHTKKEICEGLCSITALTRYENNVRVPDKFLLDSILQRLGGDLIKFEIIVNDHDLEIAHIRQKIELLWKEKDLNAIQMQIEEYKSIIKSSRNLHEQFIYEKQGQIQEYLGNWQAALQLYHTSLSCTECLNYTKRIQYGLLTFAEALLLTDIGKLYYNQEHTENALSIFENIARYFQMHTSLKNKSIMETIYIESIYYLAKINYRQKNWGLAYKYTNLVIKRQLSEYRLQYLKDCFYFKKVLEIKLGKYNPQDFSYEKNLIALEILQYQTTEELERHVKENSWENIVNQI
ncbi:MAG: hypothetical protein Q4F21_01335 [Lachnospiraceae bacterium]|nr:hypothetical protein [Lachnospiraceae bacterium]